MSDRTDDRSDDRDGDRADGVGSVGEEAAKLFGALSGWAKDHGADFTDEATGIAEDLAGSAHSFTEHIATGGQDCTYCPLCQVISAVRQTSPEVKQHLSTAASSLMHAVAGMLATAVPEDSRPRPDGVEKIDLSDGGDWDEE